ncbi:iron ABC transporter permease [Selenomonas sp. TAMA-11512]|uniref:ABC transporter permease n=1 Tax=Selenomonas sp. TAMA-11512 TaxID=3095337 RepID=UPI00308B7417|nr:iron ABC transporter permease [Selenomonas sp. TAMA-11512]
MSNGISAAIKNTKRSFQDPVVAFFAIAMIVLLSIFVVLPLLQVVKQSLIGVDGTLSLSSYIKIITTRQNYEAFMNTMQLAVIVSVLATIIGFLFAYCTSHLAIPGKKIFSLMAMLPMVSPPFSVAMSMIMLFGARGLITYTCLGMTDANIYGFMGLVFTQTISYFPIAFLLLAGMLRTIDPSIEDAARDLGASKWQTFRTVTLPLVRPGIANAFLLVFIKSVADFANPMAIGGNYITLATQIYLQAIGSYDMQGGAAVAVVLLNIAILLFIISKYWLEKKSYVTITGKASQARVMMRDKAIIYPVAGFCFLVSIIVIAIYALIPVASVIKVWGMDYGLTLEHYKYAVTVGGRAIKDTTLLSIVATPIAGILGMIIAYLVVRKNFIGRGYINFSSLLSIAVPGTVIGIGYIMTFNTLPLQLTGTATILIAAFVVRALPIGIRAGVSSLQQIDPSIEEAASDLGANATKVFRTITLPLIKSAFFSGLVYAFIRSMTSISAVIFLVSANYSLLTILILDQVEDSRYGVASAFSTILILIVYVAIGIINLLLRRMGSENSTMNHQ